MKLFNHVKIKSSGVTGIIVDVLNGPFTVEVDEERKPGDTSGHPGAVATVHLFSLRIGTAGLNLIF